MWKIFFTYKDKSRCTVQGKGTITPELAVLQGEGRYVDFSCAPGFGRLNHKIEPHRIYPGRGKNISSRTDSRNDGVFRITIYSV